MAFAAITSMIAKLSLAFGHQPHLARDDKQLLEVLYGLDSLRSLVDETHNVISDNIRCIVQDMVEGELRVKTLLEIREESQRTEAAFLSLMHRTDEKQGKMAYAAITSFMATISLSFGNQSLYLTGDGKELVEVLHGKLDSLRTVVEETNKIVRDPEVLKTLEAHTMEIAYTAEDMVELELAKQVAYTALSGYIKESQQRTKAAITSLRTTLVLSKEEQTKKVAYTAEHMAESKLREQGAYTTEDMVESDMREFALSEMEESQGRSICKCLQQVIEKVDSTEEEWMKMKNIYGNIKDPKPQTFDLGDSSQRLLESTNVMVGYDNELEMLQDQLVRGLGEFKVISLVGMGGIGKTAFATRIFSEQKIRSHFDVCAKITVSQECHVRSLYLGLLRYTSSRVEGLDEKNDGELADLLQKSLKGKRYLVIVDDIWTIQAWDEIRMCFPLHNNGSRILLTTRSTEVAEYASLGPPPYQMRLLTFDECWNLLYQKVTQNEFLSPEFQKIGKEIARKCQGLPLATVVMAGVLLKLGKSLDEWKKVVEDVNLFMSTDLDHYCSRVLALSYHHLPHHLRACLLYLVVFKKSSDIPVCKLVRLWAAEGFVKVKRNENFEMEAVKCLKDLIDRSLVSVNTWSFCGKIKSCGIHDMIYGFCLQEAQNINFLKIIMEKNVQRQGSESIILFPSHPCRMSIQSSWMNYQLPLGDFTDTTVRAFIYCGNRFSTKVLEFSCFKLLRVLDIISVTFNYQPVSIGGLFSLRYLAFTINEPSNTPAIANLKNLQSLIIQYDWPSMYGGYGSLCLSKGIWGMSQLRHLKSSLNYLVDPPPENKSVILENLYSLSGLNPACCRPSVLKGIANVKRLRIHGTKEDYIGRSSGQFQYCDLSHVYQLESLSIVVEETKFSANVASSATLRLPCVSAFPQNLKKLTLQATYLPWKEMRIVSELPKLEALKLERYACRGRRWVTIADGFPQLKFLLLECTDLVLWKTCSDHFPCLERLVLRDCYSLVSIPQDFADIMTLQLIELDMCKRSAVNSAKEIQQEVGENVLHVRVKNPTDQEEEKEKEFGEEEEKRKEKGKEKFVLLQEQEKEEEYGEEDEEDIEDEEEKWKAKGKEKIVETTTTPRSGIIISRSKSQATSWKVIPTDSSTISAASGTTTSSSVVVRLKNGDLYRGNFSSSSPHGSGKYLWNDGYMYVGEWRRGKASRKGQFYWPSGATFEGDFKSGRMEGTGIFIGSDGDMYKGSWSADMKHGYGQKHYSNGDYYEGHWKRNYQDGQGRYVWKNGNEYIGEWKNGAIHGRGVLIWANGNRYDGNLEAGVPKGYGVFTWPDGSCYTGCWNKNQQQHHPILNGTYYPANNDRNNFKKENAEVDHLGTS